MVEITPKKASFLCRKTEKNGEFNCSDVCCVMEAFIMWKKLCAMGIIPLFAFALDFAVHTETGGIAEAASSHSPKIAQREMKKSKDYESTQLDRRVHEIIYGDEDVGTGRIRIAIIINGDEKMVVEDRVKNEIYTQLRQKFPREHFALMKGTDVTTRLLQHAEDMYYDQRGDVTTSETTTGSHRPKEVYSGVVGNVVGSVGGFLFGKMGSGASQSTITQTRQDKVDVDGLPVGMQPRGLADMRREDYVRAGKECGYDYVFVATLTLGQGLDYRHNFIVYNSVTNKQNAWLRLRFVDVKDGNYLYRNDIPVQGVAHNGTRSGRVYQKAIHKAMEEAMNDLDF